MSKFIQNIPREQLSILPYSVDDFVSDDSVVRAIHAFTSSLDLSSLGFKKAIPSFTGTPPYNPKDLLNLYIYGFLNKTRSSRRLEKMALVNIEVIWLLNNLHPDHNTISRFRKDNSKQVKAVFKSFNKFCFELNLFSKSLTSLDGSKFKANNSKDNNFTRAKIDDRLKRLNNKVDRYFKDLDEADSLEDDEDTLTSSVDMDKIKEKIKEYTDMLNNLESSGDSQISLTDPEARLMKTSNGGFDVSYNVQTVVDSKHHLITDFEVTNKTSDNGLISSVSSSVKDFYNTDAPLETLVDGGYVNNDDLNNCLDNLIIPILPENKKGAYILERDYIPNTIDDDTRKSTKGEDVKKCLDSGVIPDCYKDLNISASIIETTKTIDDDSDISDISNISEKTLTEQQMYDKALKGYFVRDIKSDKVICPSGFILRKKSSSSGRSRYYSSTACKSCKNKCFSKTSKNSKVKIVDFYQTQTIAGCKARDTSSPRTKKKRVKVKKVLIQYTPDNEKYKLRKCLSEHPFGTVKHYDDSSYFLLTGLDNVSTEISLSFLSYNFRRVVNILGVDKLIEALNKWKNGDDLSDFINISSNISAHSPFSLLNSYFSFFFYFFNNFSSVF